MGGVVPGSGEPVEPANLDAAKSDRRRREMMAMLREMAGKRGVSLSDLLRDAAGALLCIEGRCTCPSCPHRKGRA